MIYFTKHLAAITFASALSVVADGSAALADVNTRYGELQAVIDAINDPDPLMRLAQLEEILKKGNATEVQLAIRTAFQLDDPNVRSLALRAHFASFRSLIVTAELPKDIQAIFSGNDKQAIQNWSGNHLYKFLRDQGFQFAIQTEYPTSDALEFQVQVLNNRPHENETKHRGNGNIRGGLINIITGIYYANGSLSCSFEFTGYEGFTMVGMGTCNEFFAFQFPVKLHLFDNS